VAAAGVGVTGTVVPPVPARMPDLYRVRAPRMSTRPPKRSASAASGTRFLAAGADAGAGCGGVEEAATACPHDGQKTAFAAMLAPHFEQTVVCMGDLLFPVQPTDSSDGCAG
jgi:hypothetical protein